jgi:uncharacterized membrane protein YphA (DoxX/SURF4 family)
MRQSAVPMNNTVRLRGSELRMKNRTMNLNDIRNTSENRVAGIIRIFLAVLFVMTGAMKLLVPVLAQAWSGQLLASGLPLYEISRWSVPFIEIGVGAVLAAGAFARLAVLIVMGIMAVATYVHLVVDDPSLFPLQPTEPIIPIVVVVLSMYVLWKGAGAWSRDLNAAQSAT